MDEKPGNPLIDLDAERAVVGDCFTDNTLIEKCSFLKPDDFADQAHQLAWQAMKKFHADGMMATPATIFQTVDMTAELDSLKAYFASCANGAAIWQTVEKAKHLKDLSLRRQIVGWAKEAIGRAECFDAPSDEVVAQAIGDFQRLASDGLRRAKTKREVALEAVEELSRPLPCYPTGLPSLDASMGGGAFAGKCYGIAARKKVGKTIALGTISHNMNAAGIPHLFIAMEMSPKELEQRNLSRAIRCNSVAFLKRNDHWLPKKAAEYAMTMPDHTVYEHGAGSSLDDIRRMVAAAQAKYKIKGVFLDYWQLVGGKQAKETEEYHLRTVAQWVADMCRKEGLFAIVAAQVNQDGNTRGGEGLKLACDQYYTLHREKDQDGAWLEMEESRYTMYTNVGSELSPGLYLQKNGPYFEDANGPMGEVA